MPQYNTSDIQKQYQIVREGLSSNLLDDTYVSYVEDVDIIFADNTGEYAEHTTATIKWKLDIDTRSWGIKYININIEDILIEYTAYTTDEQGRESAEDRTIKVGSYDSEWNRIRTEKSSQSDCTSMYPDRVEVYYKDKSIIVYY